MTLLSDPELLARLVAVDSTSHLSNLPLARALADYVARPGVRSDLLPSPEGGKANLLVRAGPEEVDGGVTLAYGHYGRPVVAFPSEDGQAADWEDRGMV